MSSAAEGALLLSERARDVADQARDVYLSFEEEAEANEALLRTALISFASAIHDLSTRIKGYETRGVAVGTAPAGKVPDISGRVLYACPGRTGDRSTPGGVLSVVLIEGLLRGGEVVSLAGVTVAEAASRYRADQVLACMLRKCVEQLGGNAAKRGRQAMDRAERLRALRVVVEAILA